MASAGDFRPTRGVRLSVEDGHLVQRNRFGAEREVRVPLDTITGLYLVRARTGVWVKIQCFVGFAFGLGLVIGGLTMGAVPDLPGLGWGIALIGAAETLWPAWVWTDVHFAIHHRGGVIDERVRVGVRRDAVAFFDELATFVPPEAFRQNFLRVRR